MPTDEAQEYIDNIARTMGTWPKPAYVPDFHKIMAAADFDVLKAQNALGQATYGNNRSLDARTKELLFIAMFTVLRCGREQLNSHVQMALDLGITPAEVLETMELALPVAGIVAFLAGFEAWREVTGAQGIEPSVPVDG
ncbi:MAG: carboxymuconolactone decarboxylase family protein [Acidimicrobiales bacterium]|jgi:4-carboxymuconolactone decarboxylase